LNSQRRRRRPIWPGLQLLAAALCCTGARAADPQPYTLSIQGTGIKELDSTLRASAQLESLRTSSPVGPFALIGRAQLDLERLATVLDSFGFYRRSLKITINGQAFDDPGLPDLIAALPKDHPAKVDIAIELGPLYHLRRVTIDGEISAGARAAMKLDSGAPAIAAEVLAARERLLTTLQEEGHALAKVGEPVAFEDLKEPVLDVEFKVDVGPILDLGEIRFTGLKRMHEQFIRKRLLLHPGEQYRTSRIEGARADLLSLGVFSGVTVHTATEVDAQGHLPLTFELQERPRHAVTVNAAYSSDLGGSVGTTWSDRDVFGNAEQLNVTASAINLGGNATTGLGYDLAAQLIKPDFLRRDQSLQFSLAALKQDLIAYQQTAATGGVSVNRKISPVWTVSVGVSLEQEHILQEGEACLPPAPSTAAALAIACEKVPRDYSLFSLPISAKYDSTGLSNPLADPVRGLRATLTVTPTESLGNGRASATPAQSLSNGHATVAPNASGATGDATFVVIQATASTYFDLEKLGWTKPGRSVIALRALGGLATGAGEFSLPPDQRFYGGGSLTVRGYPYQSVGPQFVDSNPIGGTAIEAVGAEFRQRFGEHFGTVVFFDAGEVTATTRPFQGTLSVGFGTGLRYYTPIGPIRLDVGFPTSHPPGGIPFVEVYVGLGQVF
jgi:translocation and assembly module TamA